MNAKSFTILLILTVISSGCKSIAPIQVVNVDWFCGDKNMPSKYTPMTLSKEEFVIVEKIRKYSTFKPVIDKYNIYWATNAREYKACKK